jgi:acyl-coenzyme A thioesterase 13
MPQAKADLSLFQSGQALPWYKNDLPFFEFMGLTNLTFLRVEDGLVEFKLPITRNHLNIHLIVHGGVLATLADIGCILAVRANMPLERLNHLIFYTQNLRVDYLANTRKGVLTVCGKVVSHLRTYSLVEANIRDADGNLLVRAVGQVFRGERK